jgi:hypothetical protein
MRILMKSMMAGALVSLAAVVSSGSTNAAPCGTTTLDNWLVSGFSCTVGDKTFSGFTYSPDGFNGTNGLSNVPASSVGVGPSVLTTAGPGLQFNANWQSLAEHGHSEWGRSDRFHRYSACDHPNNRLSFAVERPSWQRSRCSNLIQRCDPFVE